MAEFFPSANSLDDGLWRNMFVFAWTEKTVAGELYFFHFVVAGSSLHFLFPLAPWNQLKEQVFLD